MTAGRRRAAWLAALAGGLALLAIPSPAPPVPAAPAGAAAFAWNRDAFWAALEARFDSLRGADCAKLGPDARDRLRALEAAAARLEPATPPGAPALDSLELAFFTLGPAVATCPALLPAYATAQDALRRAVKERSRHWDMTARPARERIYRALYGSRAALEEVLLHAPGAIPAVQAGRDEPSATPATVVEGVRVHSGDMLVSRGGYPTSALIARGSDFPGNFSHVALVHVDSAGTASTIEAHIERGVAISTAAQYLGDKKRRILVLRLRADHPALRADPLLPHRAATRALDRARAGRVPYDFAMDYTDPSRLFCSEVASSVYRDLGVTLWTGLSTISAPGLRRWLAGFGVRHFETQEPSDLEFDPQLVVVAEWRDAATLRADHVDNAVIDAMLEAAERGDRLAGPWYHLPVVRLAKGWSRLLNLVGKAGPVPEGMSAEAALRNQAFTGRQRRLAAAVTARADSLAGVQGYPPPYWTLLALAREAVAAEGTRP